MSKELRYLALGDSYTIGEDVVKEESFPYLLTKDLEESQKIRFSEIKVIAKTGWTTDELAKAIKSAKPKSHYDMVTLLIGVNNQYRSYSLETFKLEFEQLLKQAILFASNDHQKVIVVAIPDYGCTPFGAELSEKIDSELKQYNEAVEIISKTHKVGWVDIFPISKMAKTDSELIAQDNLHPSGKMYRLWVNEILFEARRIVSLT